MGSLEEIHMPQNGINHPGITALAGALQHNPQLRVVNLNDNTFTKKGAIAMAQVRVKVKVALLSISCMSDIQGIDKNVSHSPTVKHIKCTGTTTDKLVRIS